ncbi:L,D-transpeptidase [bacterium]|jgi:lipoprotein-anchoring transpeptidase ErfK/SrfK|nr:L,D-transpeptidase [bacterium]
MSNSSQPYASSRAILVATILAMSFLASCQTLPVSDDAADISKVLKLDAITFAADPGKVYVPLNEAIEYLGLVKEIDAEEGAVRINKQTFAGSSFHLLTDGTKLVTLTDLLRAGASVDRNEDSKQVTLKLRRKQFIAVVGAKSAEISLARQRLRAWQGARLVLDCRVSSGRGARTPSGHFRAGPYKARRHYSSLYNNAPMPWSVQVTGNIFIHGFSSVPNYPASHGCIRVPLDEGNPAKFFYEWVDKGTPITVTKE